MRPLYSEFQKAFIGDTKANVTAIGKDGTVLAHRSLFLETAILSTDQLKVLLEELKERIKEKEWEDLIDKYEIVYPRECK